jgi:hypothetical protein
MDLYLRKSDDGQLAPEIYRVILKRDAVQPAEEAQGRDCRQPKGRTVPGRPTKRQLLRLRKPGR